MCCMQGHLPLDQAAHSPISLAFQGGASTASLGKEIDRDQYGPIKEKIMHHQMIICLKQAECWWLSLFL